MTNDPDDSDTPLAGRCVGNSYIMVRPIGQGATGTVWRGEDRATGEPVAIKLLHESLLRQPRLVTRFVQERTILQMLRHRHVVRVRDLFSVGETLGLVMDLVAGGNLRDLLHKRGTVPPAEAVRLAGQVASALAEAHDLGIIHRDLKPDNILLSESSEARLTDFGIARILTLPSMTTPNAVVGTPHYMAPEAFHGVTPSPATDVYSLGVLLYELVSGQPPFRSDSIPELMRLHAEGRPERRPGIPDPLWRIIMMCLAAKPRQRPSAADLVTDLGFLARNLADTPALSRPGAPPSESIVFDSAARLPVPRRSALSGLPGRLRPRLPLPIRTRGDAIRSHRWSRSGATAVVIAGAMLASGLAWHAGRSGSIPAEAPTVITAPRLSPPTSPASPASSTSPTSSAGAAASVVAAAPPPTHPKTVRPAPARKVTPSRVRATRPASTRNDRRPPLPEGRATAQGRWQCAPDLIFDLRTRAPLSPRPCHQLGRDVQVQAALTAPAGGRGRIEVTLQDTRTGRTVAGPRTCDGLSFTRRSITRECGPLVAEPRRGRQYAVVMTYRYTRHGRAATSTSRGRPFRW
ncbi:putative serine/threonine protein kinase [Actinoplanes missouriensis 431]|uniref:non-specific serine/threonine protein kinase n=1 Tax=Actinoplanes missouriensis (strain ATCC 14538 / DSM 43046 / CBS 188.64 / JCM 3121 / NBRC 102363 / NCIMB 12654 / NRRL B-3342 / UNCC 431) TaxID=512565 RepID=I0HFC5_ACTM4|nr:serine/threonine-protein kinase [Actinoplanes missouriensis]BAL91712.1 putative serine/threonine protein kinase [Actinoplanes missouriensis 431]